MSAQPHRRALLLQAAALAGAALTPAIWTSAVAQTRLAETPFTLGVASGDPTPDGVVLWTRLATRPRELGGGMSSAPVRVRWQVAEDAAMTRVVRRGETVAAAEAGHSVHVEVEGLRPDRWYWYRFSAAGHESALGRTRTAPSAGAPVERLKIAYGSCQKFEPGYYAAHAAIAADAPDLVLFLGDYIYEGAATSTGVRRHPELEARDLATYRLRYAWYKTDPDLQAAHAAAPWAVIWDDHEVDNDYGGDQDRTPATSAEVLARRAAAYQAFYENMPLRRTARPVGPDMQLYRSLSWGGLADLQVLDTRQYRPHRTCDAVANGKRIPPDCPDRFEPARSLLGGAQEAWLHREIGASRARWNLLGQQYLMGEAILDGEQVSNDGWDGYAQTRRRLLETWRDSRTANPVVLGGDIHCFFAGDLALPGGPVLASEFVGGSISSLGRDNATLAGLVRRNPNLKYAEGEHRGFGRVELTRDLCRVSFRAVDDARVPNAPVREMAAFVVEAGAPGVKRV